MKLFKSGFFILNFITLSINPILAMNTGVNAAYKHFDKVCTAAHYVFAFGGLATAVSFTAMGLKTCDEIPDHPLIKEFVNSELKNVGLKESMPVKLVVSPLHFDGNAQALPHAILVGSSLLVNENNKPIIDEDGDTIVHSNLLTLLQMQAAGITLDGPHKNMLNQYKFIFQHEGNHIKNNDHWKTTAAYAISPFATHFGLKSIQSKKPKTISATPSVLKSLAKIPSGLAKGVAATLLATCYEHHREQEADNNVKQTEDILTGAYLWTCAIEDIITQTRSNQLKTFAEQAAKKNIPLLAQLFTTIHDNYQDKESLTHHAIDAGFDPKHPTSYQRKKEFKKRLAAVWAAQEATIQADVKL